MGKMDFLNLKQLEYSLDLPQCIVVGEAISDGDCFFDSLAQCFRQKKPNVEFSAKSLRDVCHKYALTCDWVKVAVAKDARLKSCIDPKIKDSDIWKKYVFGIQYTADDIEQLKNNGEHMFDSFLSESEYGVTLIPPIWGTCEIEGRIICDKYSVKLHVIEKHNIMGKEVWAHQLVDRSCSKTVGSVNYNQENTVHLVNIGDSHFRPLLLKRYVSNHGSKVNSQPSIQQVPGSSEYSQTLRHIEHDEHHTHVVDYIQRKNSTASVCKLTKTSAPLCDAYNGDEITRHYLNDRENISKGGSGHEIEHVKKRSKTRTMRKQQSNDLKNCDADRQTKNQKIEFHKKKGTAGASGHFFEIKLSTILFLKGLSKEIEYFYLASNMDEAETVDDVVFKYKYIGNDKPHVLFIQTKHKDGLHSKDESAFSERNLITGSKCDFNLRKCFSSYLKIRQHFSDLSTTGHPIFGGSFDDCDFIIYTNDSPLHIKNIFSFIKEKTVLKESANKDSVLNLPRGDVSEPVNFYRVMYDKGESMNVFDYFSYSSDCLKLARELAESVFIPTRNTSELEINFRKPIFRNYNIPLKQKVFQKGRDDQAVFKESFLNGDGTLSVHDKQFRNAFFKEAEKFLEKPDGDLKSELRKKSIKITKKFWNTDCTKPNEQQEFFLPSDVINAKDIKGFFSKLKLFFGQPNEQELGEIIKRMLQEIYRVGKSDIGFVFSSLKDKVTDWWQKENHYITKDDKFIKDILRVSIFTVGEHVVSFTGRKQELSQLHSTLQRNNGKEKIAGISHMTLVCGLGGIGKTELVRKYAWEYKNFYDGNVLWINAENYSSLCSSFHNLAQNKRINISMTYENGKEKPIACVVSEIYDFFAKRKSLFIFDNAERSEDVYQFLRVDPLIPDPNKPYILITSREMEWENGIEVIKLTGLKPEDANQLVVTYLNICEPSDETETRKLVDMLQCFPLVLQQAVAYIADQRVVRKYRISDYVNEFEKKTEQLLTSAVFQGISNDYTKTTYTTWQITIDQIKRKGTYGYLASDILNILAYLPPDGIRRNLFYNLSVVEDVKQAIRLLVNYSMLDAETHQKTLGIHRLVQYVIRLNLEKDHVKEKTVLRKALKLLEQLPNSTHRNHYATVWNYVSKYSELIDDFYFDSFYGPRRESPLHLLITVNNYKAFKTILEHIRKNHSNKLNVVIDEKRDKLSETLLHTAVKFGNLQAMKYLVSNGATINAISENMSGSMECISIVRSKFNLYDDSSRNRTQVVAAENEFEMWIPRISDLSKRFWYFFSSFPQGTDYHFTLGDTPLHYAVYSRNVHATDYLIAKGADVKALNLFGITSLHTACFLGDLDIAKLLFVKGSDNNASCRFLTPLDTAAAGGNLDLVRYLIVRGADVKVSRGASGKFYVTPLHIAADEENISILEYLLDKGADINVKNSRGETPLYRAVQKNSLRFVEYLIDKGAHINCINNEYNETPLHLAAKSGHLDLSRFLLIKGADVTLPDNHGNTPLHTAARTGHLDVLKFLVESGADFTFPNNHGNTPLHMATEELRQDALKYLVETGADFISFNNYGRSPIHLLFDSRYIYSEDDRFKVATYLIQKGADITSPDNEGNRPFHLALRRKNFVLATFLLEKGVNVNSRDKNNNTPVHLAARHGGLEVVKRLIEKGADFNCHDKNNNTPMHWIVRHGVVGVVKELVEKGAHFNCRNKNNSTPLHWAAAHGLQEIVEFLIEKGGDFTIRNNDGNTPLHLAAKTYRVDILKFLMLKGADFISPNAYGMTPVHLAAAPGISIVKRKNIRKKHAFCDLPFNIGTDIPDLGMKHSHAIPELQRDAIRLLLNSGANINILDKNKRAPIHYAAQSGNIGIVKLLIGMGAGLTSPDKYGYTPIDLAARNDHMNIVQRLLQAGVNVNFPGTFLKPPLPLGALYDFSYLADPAQNSADPMSLGNCGKEQTHSTTRLKTGELICSRKSNEGRRSLYKNIKRYINTFSVQGFSINAVSRAKQGDDFVFRDEHGRTPIHFAAENNNCDLAQFLIGKGADFDSHDCHGNSPLHLAIGSGDKDVHQLGDVNTNSDVAKYLISKGVRLDSVDDNRKTPIHLAAKSRKLDVLKLLIEEGPHTLINCFDQDKRTPLHYAAKEGCLHAAKLLIENGVDLNCTDKDNRTPVYLAARGGHLDVLKHLLQQGADINRYENNGNTPLHVAASYGQFYAAKCLLSKGADVSSGGNSGNTPMHLAACRGSLDVVKLLVEQGSGCRVKNKKGRTPLHCASSSGKLNVVQYLLTKDTSVDVCTKDNSGNTSLCCAAAGGKLNVVRFFIEKKNANFKTANNVGNTPLHLASSKGALFVVKYLVEELNADCKVRNNVGNTPLHLAAQKGALNIVKYFTKDIKTDFEVRNNVGCTPLDLAAQKGRIHVVKYLLEEKNCDFEVPDNK